MASQVTLPRCLEHRGRVREEFSGGWASSLSVVESPSPGADQGPQRSSRRRMLLRGRTLGHCGHPQDAWIRLQLACVLGQYGLARLGTESVGAVGPRLKMRDCGRESARLRSRVILPWGRAPRFQQASVQPATRSEPRLGCWTPQDDTEFASVLESRQGASRSRDEGRSFNMRIGMLLMEPIQSTWDSLACLRRRKRTPRGCFAGATRGACPTRL